MRKMSLVVPLAVLALAAAGAGGFLYWRQTIPGVRAQLSPAPTVIGAATPLGVDLEAAAGSVTRAEVRLVQGATGAVVSQHAFPADGQGRRNLALTLEAAKLGLKDGPATLEVYAQDDQWRPRGAGAGPVLAVPVTVDLTPPLLEVLSATRYLDQGGAGVAVLRAQGAARVGMVAGGVTQPAFPAGPEGVHVALFALPWNSEPPLAAVAFAEDEAGNRVTRGLPAEIRPKAFPSDVIEIPERLLTEKVPELLPGMAGKSGEELLAGFLVINGDQRREAEAQKRRIGAETAATPLWAGAFSQMPNTKVFANFAETRTYQYRGQVVDTQVHLGYDLASTKHAPIPAAQAGRVVFAGPLTIYGNAVVVDHGWGLQTLYSHLSSLGVQPGDGVTKGQELGRSGMTGLALGDHLHFEVMIHGVSVTPVEWWDGKWIRDRVYLPLTDASLALFPDQKASEPAPAAAPAKARRKR